MLGRFLRWLFRQQPQPLSEFVCEYCGQHIFGLIATEDHYAIFHYDEGEES